MPDENVKPQPPVQTVPIDQLEPVEDSNPNKENPETKEIPRYFNSETNPKGDNQGVINVQS